MCWRCLSRQRYASGACLQLQQELQQRSELHEEPTAAVFDAAGNPAGAMYHMTMDSWIEFVDADHARHHSYWQTVFVPAKSGESPRMAAAGRGIDDLVRVNGQWLIKLRDVAPQD